VKGGDSVQELMAKIDAGRERMHRAYMCGDGDEALRLSQELDFLILEWYRFRR